MAMFCNRQNYNRKKVKMILNPFIGVAGNIGVGKTTFTDIIS